jgi:hypothetical protein
MEPKRFPLIRVNAQAARAINAGGHGPTLSEIKAGIHCAH